MGEKPKTLAEAHHTVEKTIGIYQKYKVRRVFDPVLKHANCHYFVLDLDHDKFAASALRAYAEECAVEYPVLAQDLRRLAEERDLKTIAEGE